MDFFLQPYLPFFWFFPLKCQCFGFSSLGVTPCRGVSHWKLRQLEIPGTQFSIKQLVVRYWISYAISDFYFQCHPSSFQSDGLKLKEYCEIFKHLQLLCLFHIIFILVTLTVWQFIRLDSLFLNFIQNLKEKRNKSWHTHSLDDVNWLAHQKLPSHFSILNIHTCRCEYSLMSCQFTLLVNREKHHEYYYFKKCLTSTWIHTGHLGGYCTTP